MDKRTKIGMLVIVASCIFTGCTKEVENKEVSVLWGNEQIQGRYTGKLEDRKTVGQGTFVVMSENSEWNYVGEFNDGKISGTGSVNDYPYRLEFQNINYDGFYSGMVLDGVPSGKGTFICDLESMNWQYDGNFTDGSMTDSGEILNFPITVEIADESYSGIYSGSVLDGKPNSEGIFVYSKDDIAIKYDGNWENGKIKGEGKLESNNLCVKFSDGINRIGTYKGSTKDGLPDGEGSFEAATDDNVSYVYSGGWKAGKWHGYGEQIYEENEFDLINRKGTFIENDFAPTPGELMQYIAEIDGMNFTVNVNKKNYIDKNKEIILAGTGYEDLVDTDLTYEKYTKKNSSYIETFMESETLRVSQIWEYDSYMSEKGCITEFICNDDNNMSQIYYVFYLGSLPDVYENTKVKIIGIPVSSGSFNNVGGGKTNCNFFIATSVVLL